MSVGVRPDLPAALAGLPETPASWLVPDGASFCLLHGKQAGGNCPECDKHFPELVAARSAGAAQPTILVADVQKIVDAAVQKALKEQLAFEKWKASPEGQAAAAAAPTAGQAPPDHGTRPGDPPSGVVG